MLRHGTLSAAGQCSRAGCRVSTIHGLDVTEEPMALAIIGLGILIVLAPSTVPGLTPPM
jgi:hypothetical protein